MPNTQVRTTRETLMRFAVGSTALVQESVSHAGYGQASGNGAADGTTLVAAATVADSGSADTYNGFYWVRMLSGSNKGLMRRVTDDDGAGTLTFEGSADGYGFPSQIASGDQFQLLLVPDPGVAVATGVPTTTEFIDADRNEADDYWNGYYAIPITGSARGEVQRITDFDNGTGTFTTEAFSVAPAAGDVILIRKYLEIGSFDGGFEQTKLERRTARPAFTRGRGVVGAKGSGPMSFESDLFASGTLAASGTPNALSALMTICGLNLDAGDTGSTVSGAASTTTTVDVATATHENYEIGNAIMINGEARIITAKADGGAGVDTLTVTPALSHAPEDGDTIYCAHNLRKTTDGDVNFGIIEVEMDGVRHTFFGCRGTFELADGQPNTITWNISYEHYAREIQPAPENPAGATTSGYSAVPFLASHDKQVWVDATAADIGGFTCTPDVEITARNVSGRYGLNGVAGHQVTDFKGGATYRELLYSDEDLAREQDFQAQTQRDLIIVWGSHERCVVFRMPKMTIMEGPHPDDEDGLQGTPIVVTAEDAGTATDPASGVVRVPDWSIHIF